MASTPAGDVAHDVHLHASDFLPSAVETHALKTTINEQTNTIQALDAQIVSLEAQLRDLRAQRVALVRSSTVKKALLAPIRKVAPEILGQVFELCNSDSAVPGVRRVITADSTPILLGLVCRKWRRVAVGTPQLWTVIALERTSELTSKVNPFIVIPEWLRRSGCLPIDVYIGEGMEALYNSEKHARAFLSCMEMLGHHFHRCQSFHVTNASDNILTAMFPPGCRRNASSLRNFRVIPSTSVQSQLPFVLGQIAAPNLEIMDVYRPSAFFDSITLDYARLRTLRWNTSSTSRDRGSSLESLIRILSLCPNLEECEIVHPPHTANSSAKLTSVSVPSLRRLTLKFTLQTNPGPLLGVLQLPGLETFHLDQMSPISRVSGFGPSLSLFISAASIPLKELRITRVNLTADDIPLLSPLSRLESLQLDNCFIHPAFLAAITPSPEEHPDAWKLPKLSSLRLTNSGFDVAALVEMIEGRVAKPNIPELDPLYRPRIDSISLSLCRLSKDYGNALTSLVARHEGLRINISD